MREILFKGRIKDEEQSEFYDKWFYGDLLHYADRSIFIRQIETGSALEVIPKTVCQFIKKHNEVSIWENDKYGEDEEGYYYAIQWSDRNCSFIVNYFNKDGKLIEENCIDVNDLLQYYELTGNIHD